MKKLYLFFISLILFQTNYLYSPSCFASNIRQPAVAGRFYPSDPEQLSNAVKNYLNNAAAPFVRNPVAIIAPHAGYIYSGQICADAFKQAGVNKYDLIVILGTNHKSLVQGISIYPEGGYKTPLGIAYIDTQSAKILMSMVKEIRFNQSAHLQEHSIEVMIPFIQTLFPDAKILPAIIGPDNFQLNIKFGKALAKVIKNKKALIVASSDLSHYPDYDNAVLSDTSILKAIISLDPEKLENTIKLQKKKTIPNLSTCICGKAPVIAAMAAAKALEANCGQIISYANSGDSSIGNPDQVVGYGAVIFSKSENCINHMPEKSSQPQASKLNVNQKKELLNLARNTITQYLTTQTTPLGRSSDPRLMYKQGAFVTLKKHGRLRGCIGHMRQDRPLCQVVSSMAFQAGFNDYRFNAVTLDELSDLEIEISVLTPFKQVKSFQDIIVGKHGVLIKKAGRSAVFLPQVAPEQRWNREQMLHHLCLKAGLPSDAWKKNTQFYTFQALVFSESELNMKKQKR